MPSDRSGRRSRSPSRPGLTTDVPASYRRKPVSRITNAVHAASGFRLSPEAGIQARKRSACGFWIPAFAGMTDHPASRKSLSLVGELRALAIGCVQRVIPAEAGIQARKRSACGFWIPAFAGMTDDPAARKSSLPLVVRTASFGEPGASNASYRRKPVSRLANAVHAASGFRRPPE